MSMDKNMSKIRYREALDPGQYIRSRCGGVLKASMSQVSRGPEGCGWMGAQARSQKVW